MELPPEAAGPRLLDRVRSALRLRHRSPRTEDAYVHWVRRFIWFHDRRHPAELGDDAITAFLTHLAVDGGVSASTQNQALNALVFLYREVLGRELGDLPGIVRARRTLLLPVVLSRAEVFALLAQLRGAEWLVAALLYGSGLRLLEALTLRVKDADFGRHELRLRRAKGAKDRVAPLPDAVSRPTTSRAVASASAHASGTSHRRWAWSRVASTCANSGTAGHRARQAAGSRSTGSA